MLYKIVKIAGYLVKLFLLIILYYVIITPFSFVYRIFRGDHLILKRNPDRKSYFIVRNHTYKASDLETT